MDYKKKYLKYKLKYLTAKKLFGGMEPMELTPLGNNSAAESESKPEPELEPAPKPEPAPVVGKDKKLNVKPVIKKPKKPIESTKKDDSLLKEMQDMRKQMGTPDSKNVKTPKDHKKRAKMIEENDKIWK